LYLLRAVSCKTVTLPLHRALQPFEVFKYGVYLLLALNIFAFLIREWAMSAHTIGAETTVGDLISMFAATIDTASWVILLLLFEFETSWVPAMKRKPRRLWIAHWVRAACYGLIVYAFYGYAVRCADLYGTEPVHGAQLCEVAAEQPSYLVGLDELVTVTGRNCAELEDGTELMSLARMHGNVLSGSERLAQARALAWTDVINAGLWILVVLMLEVDLRLKARHHLGGRTGKVVRGITIVVYLGLLACGIYWGLEGTFLDFWDAFLWLLAFAAIEMNVFRVADRSRFSAHG
jgi:hypothetical protein